MFKIIYAKVVSLFCKENTAKIDQTIFLMFHSIGSDLFEKKSIYHMSLERFKEICLLLDEIRNEAFNENGNYINFVFTFDDGYLNYVDNALPVLEQYSYKSIVFLIAKHLNDKTGKYINLNILKQLLKNNLVTIGMHGYSHVDLSSLSDVDLKNELANIKKVCDAAGIETSYFSLPFGKANYKVITKLHESGYKDIFTSDYGFKTSNKNGQSLYPRIDLWANDSNQVIKQKIMKYWRLFFIIESRRSKLYRIHS